MDELTLYKVLDKAKLHMVDDLGFTKEDKLYVKNLSPGEYVLSDYVLLNVVYGKAYRGQPVVETLTSLIQEDYFGDKILDDLMGAIEWTSDEANFLNCEDEGYENWDTVEEFLRDAVQINVDEAELRTHVLQRTGVEI